MCLCFRRFFVDVKWWRARYARIYQEKNEFIGRRMNLSGEERIYQEKSEFIRRRVNLSGEE